MQIVALGGGKFHGVAYNGGLPGDGWDKKTKLDADGETNDGVTVFKRKDSTSTYKDGALSQYLACGEEVRACESIALESRL